MASTIETWPGSAFGRGQDANVVGRLARGGHEFVGIGREHFITRFMTVSMGGVASKL